MESVGLRHMSSDSKSSHNGISRQHFLSLPKLYSVQYGEHLTSTPGVYFISSQKCQRLSIVNRNILASLFFIFLIHADATKKGGQYNLPWATLSRFCNRKVIFLLSKKRIDHLILVHVDTSATSGKRKKEKDKDQVPLRCLNLFTRYRCFTVSTLKPKRRRKKKKCGLGNQSHKGLNLSNMPVLVVQQQQHSRQQSS